MTDAERLDNLTERVARLEEAAGYTPDQRQRFHNPPRATPPREGVVPGDAQGDNSGNDAAAEAAA